MKANLIAEEVGITYNQVNEVFKRYKTTNKHNQIFKLNELQEQIILSGILGDGRLKKNGKYNYYYSECHALDEKEYCEWKKNALGDIAMTNMYAKKLNNQSSNAIEFCTKTSPTLIPYAEKTKKEVIKTLNQYGLCLFILDDGWFSNHSKLGNFCISGGTLSIEELDLLCMQYEKYGINNTHIIGNKRLDLSIPSSNNVKIYEILSSIIPINTDIMQKKFKHIIETKQINF